MIDNALSAGCLKEVFDSLREQEAERMRFNAWLIRGRGDYEYFKANLKR